MRASGRSRTTPLGASVVALVGLFASGAPSCKTNNIQSTTNNDYVTEEVGPAGQTIMGPGGSTLIVPMGAVTALTALTIREIPAGGYPALPAGVTLTSPVFAFEPHGQAFVNPVTIKLPGMGSVHHAVCAAGTTDATACMWDTEVPGQGAPDGTTVFTTPTFSLYALADDPDAGAPDGGVSPCAGIVSAPVCGSGTNANVLYTCMQGNVASQTVCPTGSQCVQNGATETPGCAQWIALAAPAAPPANDGFLSAVLFNNKLMAITNTGQLWVSAKDLPTSANDWSLDTNYTTAVGAMGGGTVPAHAMATAAPTDLWVVGGSGVVMHGDANDNWTMLPTVTTANLHDIDARYISGLQMMIAGDNGTVLTNPSHDGVTLVPSAAATSDGGKATQLDSAAVCNPFCLAGGKQLGLFHGPNPTTWVTDTTSQPVANANDVVWQVTQLDAMTALAATRGSGGNVLQATISDPTQPVNWTSVYSSPSGLHGVGVAKGGRAFACGERGAMAIRDAAGNWTDSPTGVTVTLSRIVNLTGAVLAIGGAANVSPVVLEYVGP